MVDESVDNWIAQCGQMDSLLDGWIKVWIDDYLDRKMSVIYHPCTANLMLKVLKTLMKKTQMLPLVSDLMYCIPLGIRAFNVLGKALECPDYV